MTKEIKVATIRRKRKNLGDKIINMIQEEIYKLHKKYSRGNLEDELLDLIWTHSLIVREIALQLGEKLIKKGIKINLKLVEVGALVHDIGCYDCYESRPGKNIYIEHGKMGYQILKKEKFDEEITRMAKIHLGVGLTKENIIKNKLPLKKEHCIPITLEEELVAYADNFHSKAGPKFLNFKEARERLLSFLFDSSIIFDRFENKFGKPELSNLEKKYNDWQKKMAKIRKNIKAREQK